MILSQLFNFKCLLYANFFSQNVLKYSKLEYFSGIIIYVHLILISCKCENNYEVCMDLVFGVNV